MLGETAVALAAAGAAHPASAAIATASAVASTAPASGTVAAFMATTVPSVVASMLPSGVTTTAPVTSSAVTVPLGWELTAVFAGALAGAFTAVEHKFDIMGVFTLAVVTGLGGGIIRDLIIQKYGVAAFSTNSYLLVALAAGLVAFFFTSFAGRLRPWLLAIDALSLGLFAVVGADKALRAGFLLVPAILLGAVTSTGGGVMRDLLSHETPRLLRPGTIWGFAAVVGSALFVGLVGWLGITKTWAAIVTVVVVLALRGLALWRGWETPTPTDLSPHVVAATMRAAELGGWVKKDAAEEHEDQDSDADD